MNGLAKLKLSKLLRQRAGAELVQIDSSSSADLAVLPAESTIIPYNPARRVQRKLNSLGRAECIAQVAIALILVACTLLFGFKSTLLALGLLGILLLVTAIRALDRPAWIILNQRGIRLGWKNFGVSSAIVPWENVSLVSGVTGGGKEQIKTVTMRLLPGSFPVLKKLSSLLMYSDFMTGWEPLKLTLDLEAIEYGGDRQRLYKTLARFLPADRIDRHLADFVTPLDPGSYTRLWLDSLSAPPDRGEYEPLVADTVLCNDRYRVDRPIGSGGQGTVYQATVLRKDKGDEPDTVVLKEFVLPVQGGKEASVKSLAHVEQEAELLKRLDHEQVVKFFDMFVEDHRAYLVLQFAQGSSLRDVVVESGALDEAKVKAIALQMCDILSYLHGQTPPVIHRDFTPENLMLGPDGLLTLIDFNVAQQLDCTTTRTIAGKHAYIPPEQFRGTATAQSDIYAAGASLFYLLTAEEPEPISVSHPATRALSVSQEIDEIVAHATALDVTQRYADSSALQIDLERLHNQQ